MIFKKFRILKFICKYKLFKIKIKNYFIIINLLLFAINFAISNLFD